jgi:hypothetical protein
MLRLFTLPKSSRVDLKPATKHYWNQVVSALLASWRALAEKRLLEILAFCELAEMARNELKGASPPP